MIIKKIKNYSLKLLFLLFSLLYINFFTTSAQADSEKGDYLVLTTKKGDITIKLRPDIAPNHVKQIQKLTQEGLYDHVVFHRVIDGFMAQTGDVQYGKKGSPEYNEKLVGTGGSKYPNIKAEFSDAKFLRGTVGMARSSNVDSANSQFFICFTDTPFLEKNYTVVGEVVKGMDVVDLIKKGDSQKNGAVENPDEILKAHLENKL